MPGDRFEYQDALPSFLAGAFSLLILDADLWLFANVECVNIPLRNAILIINVIIIYYNLSVIIFKCYGATVIFINRKVVESK